MLNVIELSTFSTIETSRDDSFLRQTNCKKNSRFTYFLFSSTRKERIESLGQTSASFDIDIRFGIRTTIENLDGVYRATVWHEQRWTMRYD